eukprot:UN07632
MLVGKINCADKSIIYGAVSVRRCDNATKRARPCALRSLRCSTVSSSRSSPKKADLPVILPSLRLKSRALILLRFASASRASSCNINVAENKKTCNLTGILFT